MSGDISGVPDEGSALARTLEAWAEPVLPVPDALLLPELQLKLPYDTQAITPALEIAYRTAGFAGLQALYEAVEKAHANEARGDKNEETSLNGGLAAIDDLVDKARQRIGDIGDQTKNRAALQIEQMRRDYQTPATVAALERLKRKAKSRESQMRALREGIDQLAEIEEIAQRWYERKLMESIDLEFAKRREDLKAAWKRYKIGDAKTKVTVVFDDVKSAEGLAILATDDQGKVTVAKDGGAHARIQGEETELTVPAVIQVTHELAVKHFHYRKAVEQAIKAREIEARKRPVEASALPAWSLLQGYRKALEKWGEVHFIAYAAHRKLYRNSADIIFDRQKVEAAVIRAFIEARDTMPEILADMRTHMLFQDEQLVAETGRGAIAKPAAEILIGARYGERIVFVKDQPNNAKQDKADQRRSSKVFRSPWLQQPFHQRLQQLADLWRSPPSGEPGTDGHPHDTGKGSTGTSATDAGPADTKPKPASARELRHLMPLFKDASDRQMLLWVTSVGTLMERARLEVVERLSEHAQAEEDFRKNLQIALAVGGVVGAPFTAGKSLVLAGAIDAVLVTEQASVDVERWITAKQFSKVVLDEVAAAHWSEPEVSMLVGQMLEAGFEVAADLLQQGAIAMVFDTISVAQLLLAVPDLASLGWQAIKSGD